MKITSIPDDVGQMIRDRMAKGGYATEGDLLRDAILAFDRFQGELAAIQEGFEDMEAGRFVSLEEFDAQTRNEFGFKKRSNP